MLCAVLIVCFKIEKSSRRISTRFYAVVQATKGLYIMISYHISSEQRVGMHSLGFARRG